MISNKKEIGGYIELDTYNLPMLHEKAIALNCGRSALAYLIKTKEIKKIRVPKFICNSVIEPCIKAGISIRYYSINEEFAPVDLDVEPEEWIYFINYYGQFDNRWISKFCSKYKKVIIDNAQAYFQSPIEGMDTIYTCRKFFGVTDGAFLYTDKMLNDELKIDESFNRMKFILGRFERTASEFYNDYSRNNELFSNEDIKAMSKLTKNLLHAIDYDEIRLRRTSNFCILKELFNTINACNIKVPYGAFMYPLYLPNGKEVREKLQKENIYIPILWPDVFECCRKGTIEYDLAQNILPIPCDQRYNDEDMKYIYNKIINIM